MTIGPLDQLYLDTTSKEDLLAEINDQRRQVIEARGEWAKADRELQELRKLRDDVAALNALVEKLRGDIKLKSRLICKYKNRLGIRSPNGNKVEILTLIEKGKRDCEIEKMGYSRRTIQRHKREYKEAIEKAAQSI